MRHSHLAHFAGMRPDAIVLDIRMPGMNGIEAARRLNELLPAVKIVILTQHVDPAYVHAAFMAGVKAYVAKESASTELVEEIHRPCGIAITFLDFLARKPRSSLTRIRIETRPNCFGVS